MSPLLVHKASTLVSIQAAAKAAGVKVVVEGGQKTDDEYGKHAEVVRPVLLGRVTPDTKVTVSWDGKGEQEIALVPSLWLHRPTQMQDLDRSIIKERTPRRRASGPDRPSVVVRAGEDRCDQRTPATLDRR